MAVRHTHTLYQVTTPFLVVTGYIDWHFGVAPRRYENDSSPVRLPTTS
jgi:hypothetical protein